MDIGLKILSDITVFDKYAKYIPTLKRREDFTEIITRYLTMMMDKYPHLEKEISLQGQYIYEKKILPSMRALQFAGTAILKNEARVYNCCFLPIDDYRSFSEIMFLLLGGTGVGYSVQFSDIEKLPEIKKPTKGQKFLVGDSIEGWADAVKHLIGSYLGYRNTIPRFDFSDIRAKGSRLVTAGGKAPGPEPLKKCLFNIQQILDRKENGQKLTSLEIHDIVCHIADSVLAGGIRRAALICLFSADDEQMLLAKSNFPILNIEDSIINTGVDSNGEPTKGIVEHIVDEKKYYDIVVDYRKEDGTIVKNKTLYWVSEDDLQEVKFGKGLPWYYFEPQRGRANNSAVLVRHRVTKEFFMNLWEKIEASGSGEPGIYFTNNPKWGTNPCVEIALRPYQFCNLTEVNVSNVESQEDLNNRVKAAAFFGTLQAGFTDFHYLRPIWKKTTEKDALLGIGMTGIASMEVFKYDLTEAAKVAELQNIETSQSIGINRAARITCVKPSGTTSCVLGTSSGIHAWHNEYYLRTVRFTKSSNLSQYLLTNHPELCEQDKIDFNTICVRIPVKAPDGAVTRVETAIDLLERVKKISKEWIKPGYITGDNTHNVSATISIDKNRKYPYHVEMGEVWEYDEWKVVGEWMWENKEFYNGLSVLPFDGGTYVQAPFEDITKEQYEEKIKFLHNIDLTKVIEEEDKTTLVDELACASGNCEII